jgi:hypothetical protein
VRFVATAIAFSTILAFAAAGCGGGGASPEETWAGDVCTSLGNWKDEVQQAANDAVQKLQSPGAGTLTAVQADVNKAVTATNQLGDDLKALGPPDTESGAQAKQKIDSLVTQLKGTVDEAKQALQGLPKSASLTDVVQQLAPLAPALQSLATKVQSTLSELKASGSELKEGFDKADSCKQLR